jgi:GT2 family glycosyltransferase
LLIKPKRNLGYAKAVNLALTNTTDNENKYILLLNYDVTLISRNYIERLVDLLNSYQRCYAASGLILFEDNIVWSCGALFDPITGFNWHLFWKEPENVVPKNKPLSVDYIPFAAALIQRSVLEELGFLDEDFFVYCEDLDLALRAEKKGYFPLVDTSVKAIHHIEKGRRHGFLFRYYHQYKGNLHIFIKHLRFREMITAIIFWTILLSLVETLYLKVHPIYHLLKVKAFRRELEFLHKTIYERMEQGIVGKTKPRFKESILAMIKHLRLGGHSW